MGTALPLRLTNSAYRSREYLTLAEVNQLMEAAGDRGRHPLRDRSLLLMMFRHGLRAGEVELLRWDSILGDAIVISRLKRGKSSIHPLLDDEQQLLNQFPRSGDHIFTGERGKPLGPGAIEKIIQRAAGVANLPIKVHPHMLRHSCGYHLANQGADTRAIQDYLGHRSIQHTVRYTELASDRFRSFVW